MAKGKVTINSDAINQVVSQLSSSATALESDVAGKLPGDFQVLVDLGLLTNAVSKVQQQVSDLVAIHNSVIAEIQSHLGSSMETEDNLANSFGNGRRSGGGNGGGGDSSSPSADPEGSNTDVDKQDDGKEINPEGLIEAIPKIDDKTLIELIEFLNINKNEKTRLIDLLFDTSKSEELFVLLRKAFGEEDKLDGVTLEDYKKVQKTLLDAVINCQLSYQELDTKSILVAKEFLIEFSKNKNMTPAELLLDEKYRDELKDGLQQLYDGDNVDKISARTINNFREYVDNIAASNNKSADDILASNLRILI